MIKRAALVSTLLENKMTRMLSADFTDLAENKFGCSILEAALKYLSNNNKAMLVEKMIEFDYEQLTRLWVHGCSVFVSALQLLDQDSEVSLVSSLVGHCHSLATHIKNHGALRSVLLELQDRPCLEELAAELEPEIVELACHKFGQFVVEGLVQSPLEAIRDIVTRMMDGRVAELANHSAACIVVVAAVLHGSKHQQKLWIEEVRCAVIKRKP